MVIQEMWRQCVSWLIETGMLPKQHRAAMRESQIFDLAQTLRDGVVLSNLLNIIQPGSVDFAYINIRPQMLKFSCMQNLRVVLQSLQHVYGISDQDLFHPSDLYDMINFKQVLHTLSILSHSASSSSKFRPFPLDTGQQNFHSYRSDDEEDVYRYLPELASERELVDEEEDLYDVVPEQEKDEGIYGSVIAFKQSSVSAPKDKRSYCITEIAETEQNYVQHLEMMLTKFIEPLKRVFDATAMRIIFMNLDELLVVHNEFLRCLKQEMRDGNNGKMSRPFLSCKDSFLKYGVYCSRLNDAQEHLKELLNDREEVRIAVENCQNTASPSKFRLRELLCVPMQRILKYHLLIKELNKQTNDSHNDKSDLEKALESMQEISKYVNEVKRDCEMLSTISQVEQCLVDYTMQIPLQMYGRLLKDGELKIKNTSDNKTKTRFTMLFDQALFMTSEKNATYKLKDLVRLEDYKLEETPQSKASKWGWQWSLTALNYGSTSSIIFYAKNGLDKTKWVENMKAAYENISPLQLKGKQHDFKMYSFQTPTYCDNCNKLLLGSFFQGYYCERTKKKCHKLCLLEMWKKIDSQQVSNKSTKPDRPTLSAAAVMCKAHRDYNGIPKSPLHGAQHIIFQTGEIVIVEEKANSEWWMGHTSTNLERRGYFPASFVSPMGSHSSGSGGGGNKRAPSYMPITPRRPPPTTELRQPTVRFPEQTNERIIPLEQNVWYAGTMDRQQAEGCLKGQPSGTYLVRIRDGNLAISLIYNQERKHIRIYHKPNNTYCVADNMTFGSVPELVKYYQGNSMSSSFLGLETTLKFPYRKHDTVSSLPPPRSPRFSPGSRENRFSQCSPPPSRPERAAGISKHQSMHTTSPPPRRDPRRTSEPATPRYVRGHDVIGQAKVLYNFNPGSDQELALRVDQVVNILAKPRGDQGWWTGELDGQIGCFPSNFVQEF